MATKKKRSAGRPRLTAKQKSERSKRVRIAFDMRPEQVEVLDQWINENQILTMTGRDWSRSSAVNYLVMKAIMDSSAV